MWTGFGEVASLRDDHAVPVRARPDPRVERVTDRIAPKKVAEIARGIGDRRFHARASTDPIAIRGNRGGVCAVP